MNAIYIPKHLDEPPRILIWTHSEAALLLSPFLLGIIMGFVLWGLVGSVIIGLSLKKLKKVFEDSCMLSAAYWYLPQNKLKTLPPTHIREYLG